MVKSILFFKYCSVDTKREYCFGINILSDLGAKRNNQIHWWKLQTFCFNSRDSRDSRVTYVTLLWLAWRINTNVTEDEESLPLLLGLTILVLFHIETDFPKDSIVDGVSFRFLLC